MTRPPAIAGIPAVFVRSRLILSSPWRPDNLTAVPDGDAPSPIEFNLQHLIEHFEISEVPDVAAVYPEAYQKNLALLHLSEEIVNSANQD